MSVAEELPPGVDGREYALQFLAEAQRFHRAHGTPRSDGASGPPSPARDAVDGASHSSSSGSPSRDDAVGALDRGRWQQLAAKVNAYWEGSDDTANAKFQRVMGWLQKMQLLVPDLTWDDCQSDFNEDVATVSLKRKPSKVSLARRRELLAAIPPGQYFVQC